MEHSIVVDSLLQIELTVKVKAYSGPFTGEWITLLTEHHNVSPGDTIMWKYPQEGIKITVD